MPRTRKLTPGASPLHFFGSEVRQARTAAGMTLADLAALVACDQSTVSRIESGLLAPDLNFARTCDRTFPRADGWFTRFLTDSQEWAGALPRDPGSFAGDEASASALYLFEHALIPALVRTGDYARAVLSRQSAGGADEVESQVSALLARQGVLDRDPPPLLWVVVDESALQRQVGEPELMCAQLARLASLARRPAITVQVLTAPLHPGLTGAFAVAETGGAPSSAYLEDAADGRIATDPAVVATLAVRFRHLQTEALTPAASLDLIERVADKSGPVG
jgi:transcriptional regulator with XRE-family HTH domain